MMEASAESRGNERRIAGWLAVATAVLALDLVTKAAIQAALAPGERLTVLPFFDLVLAFNSGAAFSFLADASGWQRGLFIAIALAAIVLILYLLSRHATDRVFCAGLALILGGALGNLWDRIALGHVVAFLVFHAFGWHFWAFNLADSAITVGAGLLILDSVRAARSAQKA